jgi:hypothetical protein
MVYCIKVYKREKGRKSMENLQHEVVLVVDFVRSTAS